MDQAAKKPRRGYEIMAENEDRTGDAYKSSPGGIYLTNELLKDMGWIVFDTNADERLIKNTELGREELLSNAWMFIALCRRLNEAKQGNINTESDDVRMLMRKLQHTVKTKAAEKLKQLRDSLRIPPS